MIHTVKSFGIVNKAEIDVFLELSFFFDAPLDVGNLISGSSAFSKTRLNIWKFTVHVLLKPSLENFKHYFTGMWDECNCVVVWAFLGIAFLWDWNENGPFPVLWPLLSWGYKESWVPKNWCFWTVVLEKTLESPLDCKEIHPVHPKGEQSWVFIGRTDGEAETPILWPPDAKNWLIWKDPDAGKDWGQEKGTTEDEMVGWHRRLDGYEFEWTPGVGDEQGGLVCCGSWGRSQRVGHDWATELNCQPLPQEICKTGRFWVWCV